MVELLELLDQKDYSMAVISKSGTTTEPAVAFRILKNHLENKYGKEEARTRIVAITDKAKGALKTLANEEGYKTYIVPDNVGGRYSVLTPVGLLPIAVAGIDIEELVNGALAMETYCKENQNCDNVVAQYAVARQALYHDGKTNEILVSYEPRLHYIAEWWKQLYGESEGKEGKGIFPASDTFTTDLHSMGQYIQEGLRNLFETIISVEKPTKEIRIPLADNDLDQLNYIAGKRLSEVNRTAETATILAHVDVLAWHARRVEKREVRRAQVCAVFAVFRRDNEFLPQLCVKRGVKILADLVATASYRRTYRGVDIARCKAEGEKLTECRFDYPCRRSAPTRVQGAHGASHAAALCAHQNRHAVRGLNAERYAALRGDIAVARKVAFLKISAPRVGGTHAPYDCGVYLRRGNYAFFIHAHGGGKQREISEYRFALVASTEREIEGGRVRRLAYAAEPR